MATVKPHETQILILKRDRARLKSFAKKEGMFIKSFVTKLLDDYKQNKDALRRGN